jgi:anti-sigma regulatory factor (Ser/Thr protein kinase)
VTSLVLDLAPEPASAPTARAAVRDLLAIAWAGADVKDLSRRIDDAVLVTSELVSNAIRHGSGRVALTAVARIEALGPVLTLECSDDGEWSEPPESLLSKPFDPIVHTELNALDDGGRGLQIVRRLCTQLTIEQKFPGSRISARLG